MTVLDLTSKYRSEVIIRRWAGCWIDILVYILIAPVVAHVLRGQDDVEIFLGLVGAACIYHIALEGMLGLSIGKWLCGVRIVTSSGEAPGLWRAAVRTAARLIEVNPILFGGLPAGLVADRTRHRQRIGDLLAGTFAVKLGDLRSEVPSSFPGRILGPSGDFLERRFHK